MMRAAPTKRRTISPENTTHWTAFLQRRVMRLLLLHDPQLFQQQFRIFYVGTSFANHPLLQFYDRYIKLLILSEELLNDILPRIQLQWQEQTKQIITQEENPLQGQIDWQRTIEQASHETPGQQPLRFAMRRYQRHTALPENLLTVALLHSCRQFVHDLWRFDQQEEILTEQERQHVQSLEERLESELVNPQVRLLMEEAHQHELETLIEQAKVSLHPGANPYHDLLEWWERFSALQVGSAASTPHLSLAPRQRPDEQMNRWLYELWVALELMTQLHKQHALVVETLTLARDQLSFTFLWQNERYRFSYQRQAQKQGLAVYSSYQIAREQPLVVAYRGKVNWQEPPCVIDAVYTTNPEEAMQRLRGAMTACAAEYGLLLSPSHTDPLSMLQAPDGADYTHHKQKLHVEHYQITPDLAEQQLQEQLIAILQESINHLLQRPQPICCGVMLDRDSTNASGQGIEPYDVVCPKPHIGPGVYDLVSRERHCLQDARLCHIMGLGQIVLPPQIKRVINLDDLKGQIGQLRIYAEAILKQAEEENDEEKAEQLRHLTLQRVGALVEQYVKLHGNTALQEKFLRDGIFKEYWKQHAYCLEEETRHILISGEYVWDEYQDINLDDWAAPAIQYCRAFERELKRRFYTPVKAGYAYKHDGQWTLGSIKSMYNNGSPWAGDKKWQTFTMRAATFHITQDVLIRQFVHPMVIEKKISNIRNHLAHGEAISKATAEDLRDAILGGIGQPGLLLWLAKHIGP